MQKINIVLCDNFISTWREDLNFLFVQLTTVRLWLTKWNIRAISEQRIGKYVERNVCGLWPPWKYYSGIFLEELRKTTKNSVRIAGLWTPEPGSIVFEKERTDKANLDMYDNETYKKTYVFEILLHN
jgi:hypothetical protein